MGEKKLTSKEKEYIESVIKKLREDSAEEQRKVSFGDMEALVVEMSDITKEKLRHPTTAWRYVKEHAKDLIPSRVGKIDRRKKSEEEKTPVEKVQASEAFGNGDVDQIVANFTAQVKAAVGRQRRIVELEKEVNILRGKVASLRRVIRASCQIRQAAIGLTKTMEDLKKDGIDVSALLAEGE